jgi:hypothetical protein
MRLSKEQLSSKSNVHKQKGLQNLPKRLPKLHLYCSSLPKKASPKDSKIQPIEQSKPKAKHYVHLQIDAYLVHLDTHELQPLHPKTTTL